MNEEEKKKNKDVFVEGVERAALEGAAAETVQRFGTDA